MDTLRIIREELERRKGDIRRISDATGLSYDTVLRIKNAEGDPGFTKVAILADYLGMKLLDQAPALEPMPEPADQPAPADGGPAICPCHLQAR